MSNGKPEPVDKLAEDVVAKDAAKQSGRPGKAQPTGVSRIPRPGRWIGIGILALLVIVGGIGVYLTTRTPSSDVVAGGNGTRYDYDIAGVVPQSLAACPVLAPAEVRTLQVPDAGKMWLSGGVLHATATFSPWDEYTGQLHRDGSFHLATTHTARAVINGRFLDDGIFSGTWDIPFGYSGCPNHMQMMGHGPEHWRQAFGVNS